MGLDKDTRHCQNIETYDDCKTRLYIEHLRQECGCLPLSLRLIGEVRYKNIICINFLNVYEQDALCMTNQEIECSQTISTLNSHLA